LKEPSKPVAKSVIGVGAFRGPILVGKQEKKEKNNTTIWPARQATTKLILASIASSSEPPISSASPLSATAVAISSIIPVSIPVSISSTIFVVIRRSEIHPPCSDEVVFFCLLGLRGRLSKVCNPLRVDSLLAFLTVRAKASKVKWT